jgi:sulfoxide reductase heme-binding subunit YedZ
MRHPNWMRVAVHAIGWFPLVLIGISALQGRLSVNPIQDVEQRLGRAAFYFLVLTLACTPINTIFGWHAILRHRRTLGLYSFFYASLHFFVFAGIDYGFNLSEIEKLILEKPFILLGVFSGLILLSLAITSFDWWKKKLQRNWTNLHRLIYLAGLTTVVHYGWAKKGNLFSLQGDVLYPVLWGIVIGVLLIMRIPSLRKFMSNLRQTIRLRLLIR